nr:mechanosensitive ion channel [Thermofilum sp.]
VEDISTLFTVIRKDDNSLALIPNNMLIGSKIYILERAK